MYKQSVHYATYGWDSPDCCIRVLVLAQAALTEYHSPGILNNNTHFSQSGG